MTDSRCDRQGFSGPRVLGPRLINHPFRQTTQRETSRVHISECYRREKIGEVVGTDSAFFINKAVALTLKQIGFQNDNILCIKTALILLWKS